MKEFFDPRINASEAFDDDSVATDDYFLTKKDDLFHTGQCYESEPAETVYCKRCGGNQFNVGSGDYYTAIKCTNCKWEACVQKE